MFWAGGKSFVLQEKASDSISNTCIANQKKKLGLRMKIYFLMTILSILFSPFLEGKKVYINYTYLYKHSTTKIYFLPFAKKKKKKLKHLSP